MKLLSSSLLAMSAAAVAVPSAASAQDIKLTLNMQDYSGPGAYVAVYVTDPSGNYHSTLYVAGSKSKYYRHLRDWYRGASDAGGIDGVTGASIGSGETLTVDVNLADSLIDAGYEIHADSAVEDGNEYSNDVTLPLKRSQSGAAVDGSGYIRSLTVGM